jgi:hypothetical protein
MKSRITVLIVLLSFARFGFAQGFVNLNFETASINTITNPGGNSYTALVNGWAANTANYVNGDPTTLPFNNAALDAPAVNLEGTNNTAGPSAIQGNYSIFLQGGTQTYADFFPGHTNGASIGQSGQIPLTAQSITYWGNALQVTFNGQMLSFNAIGSGANYTVYGADISAYAGQTGALVFTTPWLSAGLLDNIQFSSSPVPEPGGLTLVVTGALLFGFRRWRGLW